MYLSCFHNLLFECWMFLTVEAMFWVFNYDLSDAWTLRGFKFWLSNAQPRVQFLMNDAYFSTEFERIWNTILTQQYISIGNFWHRTPYTFVSIIAPVWIYIWCTHAHLFSNLLMFKFIVLILGGCAHSTSPSLALGWRFAPTDIYPHFAPPKIATSTFPGDAARADK